MTCFSRPSSRRKTTQPSVNSGIATRLIVRIVVSKSSEAFSFRLASERNSARRATASAARRMRRSSRSSASGRGATTSITSCTAPTTQATEPPGATGWNRTSNFPAGPRALAGAPGDRLRRGGAHPRERLDVREQGAPRETDRIDAESRKRSTLGEEDRACAIEREHAERNQLQGGVQRLFGRWAATRRDGPDFHFRYLRPSRMQPGGQPCRTDELRSPEAFAFALGRPPTVRCAPQCAPATFAPP